MITTNEIYWLAGLIEGEGCFSWQKKGGLFIYLGMTDLDVLEYASLLFDRKVYTIRRHPPRKPLGVVRIAGSRAAGWMMTLYPLLGARRRARIRELLTQWRQVPAAKGQRARLWEHT